MAEIKTKKTSITVAEYLKSIKDESQRKDAKTLFKLMKEASGEKAKVWGNTTASFVGFGEYHYKSERSSQEGNWPLTAFSARAKTLTVYIMSGFADFKSDLKALGPHTKSKGSCLYLKSLEGVDLKVLQKMVKKSVAMMKKRYNVK